MKNSYYLTILLCMFCFASYSQSTQVCVGSTVNVTCPLAPLDIFHTGSWGSANTSLVTVSTDPTTLEGTVTGITAGVVNISYTQLNIFGIPISYCTQTITVNPLPAAITGSLSVCVGYNTTLSSATGGGVWSANNGNATIGSSTGVVTGVSAGSTVMSYTLPTGCARTAATTINAIPVVNGAGGGVICSGSAATLSATGGTTYTWAPGAGLAATTGASVSAGPASETTYTITGSTLGCSSTATVTVSVNTTPTISGGPGTVICNGSWVNRLATGGITYTWAPSSGLSATTGNVVVASPSATTIYTVTGTATNGCSNTATVTVSVNPTPGAISGPSFVCVGDNITLSCAGPGVWSSDVWYIASVGSSTGIVTGMAGGTTTTISYTLPTTGCSSTLTVSVGALPVGVAITGGGAYCSGGTGVPIGLGGSAVGINYQLYRGTSAIGSPVAGGGSSVDFGMHTTTGTYTVGATNSVTGCTDNMPWSTTVSIDPLPDVYTVTGGGNYCSGGTGVHVGLNGSDAGINYQLCNGSGTPIGSPVAGTGGALDFGIITTESSYSVKAISASTGCHIMMTGTATVTSIPDISGSTVVGLAGTMLLTGSPSGGTWASSTPSIATIDAATGLVTGISAGPVTISYSVSGCLGLYSIDCSSSGHKETPPSGRSMINSSNLLVRPNPNKGAFEIRGTLNTADDDNVLLEATDMFGRIVYRRQVTSTNGAINEQISFAGVAKGLYLLRLSTANERRVFQVVVE